jgi:hypothetical protein
MNNEKLIHDWMVSHLKRRLSRDYDEIKVNLEDEKNEHDGFFPDLIMSNHGMVLAVMEVETEGSINEEKAAEWKKIAESGTKLILMVPKRTKAKVIDLLWKQGIADKASVGSYELNINMP